MLPPKLVRRLVLAPLAVVIAVAVAVLFWRSLPMGHVIHAKWWRVGVDEVPRGHDNQVRWLYDWWERIDAWIAQNRPRDTQAPALSPGATPD